MGASNVPAPRCTSIRIALSDEGYLCPFVRVGLVSGLTVLCKPSGDRSVGAAAGFPAAGAASVATVAVVAGVSARVADWHWCWCGLSAAGRCRSAGWYLYWRSHLDWFARL